MSRTSTPVAGGTTGTLADAAPAIDRISSVDYQMMKLADATTDATTAIGVDANPLKVKNRRLGTSDYDSGNILATASFVAITAAAIKPEGGWVANVDAVQRGFSLTDGADTPICTDFQLAPGALLPIPFAPGMSVTGLKVKASAANAVRLQVWGSQ